MTDRERLEEIKNSYLQGIHRLFGTSWVLMPKENSDWLIQQAERVEKLEEEKEQLEEDLNAMKNQYVHELKVQNERYKQALEHFANLGTKHDTNPTLVMNGYEVFMLLDYIKSMDEYVRCKAQKALEG